MIRWYRNGEVATEWVINRPYRDHTVLDHVDLEGHSHDFSSLYDVIAQHVADLSAHESLLSYIDSFVFQQHEHEENAHPELLSLVLQIAERTLKEEHRHDILDSFYRNFDLCSLQEAADRFNVDFRTPGRIIKGRFGGTAIYLNGRWMPLHQAPCGTIKTAIGAETVLRIRDVEGNVTERPAYIVMPGPQDDPSKVGTVAYYEQILAGREREVVLVFCTGYFFFKEGYDLKFDFAVGQDVHFFCDGGQWFPMKFSGKLVGLGSGDLSDYPPLSLHFVPLWESSEVFLLNFISPTSVPELAEDTSLVITRLIKKCPAIKYVFTGIAWDTDMFVDSLRKTTFKSDLVIDRSGVQIHISDTTYCETFYRGFSIIITGREKPKEGSIVSLRHLPAGSLEFPAGDAAGAYEVNSRVIIRGFYRDADWGLRFFEEVRYVAAVRENGNVVLNGEISKDLEDVEIYVSDPGIGEKLTLVGNRVRVSDGEKVLSLKETYDSFQTALNISYDFTGKVENLPDYPQFYYKVEPVENSVVLIENVPDWEKGVGRLAGEYSERPFVQLRYAWNSVAYLSMLLSKDSPDTLGFKESFVHIFRSAFSIVYADSAISSFHDYVLSRGSLSSIVKMEGGVGNFAIISPAGDYYDTGTIISFVEEALSTASIDLYPWSGVIGVHSTPLISFSSSFVCGIVGAEIQMLGSEKKRDVVDFSGAQFCFVSDVKIYGNPNRLFVIDNRTDGCAALNVSVYGSVSKVVDFKPSDSGPRDRIALIAKSVEVANAETIIDCGPTTNYSGLALQLNVTDPSGKPRIRSEGGRHLYLYLTGLTDINMTLRNVYGGVISLGTGIAERWLEPAILIEDCTLNGLNLNVGITGGNPISTNPAVLLRRTDVYREVGQEYGTVKIRIGDVYCNVPNVPLTVCRIENVSVSGTGKAVSLLSIERETYVIWGEKSELPPDFPTTVLFPDLPSAFTADYASTLSIVGGKSELPDLPFYVKAHKASFSSGEATLFDIDGFTAPGRLLRGVFRNSVWKERNIVSLRRVEAAAGGSIEAFSGKTPMNLRMHDLSLDLSYFAVFHDFVPENSEDEPLFFQEETVLHLEDCNVSVSFQDPYNSRADLYWSVKFQYPYEKIVLRRSSLTINNNFYAQIGRLELYENSDLIVSGFIQISLPYTRGVDHRLQTRRVIISASLLEAGPDSKIVNTNTPGRQVEHMYDPAGLVPIVLITNGGVLSLGPGSCIYDMGIFWPAVDPPESIKLCFVEVHGSGTLILPSPCLTNEWHLADPNSC
ncbi:MAG: hypothetical protein GXO39_09295 [Thermotogae bacterium]|nr:hypothetical protein [Thermotogota bacterium]